MGSSKAVILSTALLMGAAISANADAQDRIPRGPQRSAPPPSANASPANAPPVNAPPVNAPPAIAPPARRAPPPASWYFDPYTDGSTPCVNCSGE